MVSTCTHIDKIKDTNTIIAERILCTAAALGFCTCPTPIYTVLHFHVRVPRTIYSVAIKHVSYEDGHHSLSIVSTEARFTTAAVVRLYAAYHNVSEAVGRHQTTNKQQKVLQITCATPKRGTTASSTTAVRLQPMIRPPAAATN